ncbi:Inner membrane transport protein YnfM [Pandoraea morbifera]|uniref:Inner membrane transport protein YnfM n=1 Tax=Pandoraea morbifera TaxID=2508300 RepID=A0A5E4V8H4_9BURK|nr:MFS transporter [Pandoraea morbifera]VVE08602.1 Inner membrane transport protein YnfM [Pandoraea morbifera]
MASTNSLPLPKTEAPGGAPACALPAGVARGTREYAVISRALFFGGFSTFAQLYCMQSLLPLLTTTFGITPAQASWSVSGATMMMALGLLATCVAADRVSRKRMMTIALLSSSVLTIASAFSTNFETVVILGALKGLALSGLPAIAMAYLSEEIDQRSIGMSMGLYIGGNILGGMAGRVLSAFVADMFSWRVSVAFIGLVCLAMGLEFARSLPHSRRFTPRHMTVREALGHARRHLADPALLGLYLFAGLMMGSFVSIYNYLGFHLSAPPFHLPHAAIGAIFAMYLIGVAGSFIAGPLSDRVGRPRLLWVLVALSLVGLLTMLASQVLGVVIGLAIFTFGFFGAHTVASSWVGRRATQGRAIASALYLFFYYLGSSLLGSYSGVMLKSHGWYGVIGLLAVAVVVSLGVAVAMRRAYGNVKPL